jgi:hypothetical protein
MAAGVVAVILDEFVCKDCGSRRSESEMFWTNRRGSGQCRECRKVYRKDYYARTRAHAIARAIAWKRANPARTKDFHRKAKYGVPFGTYDRILAEQGSVCAICGAPEPSDASLHIDHDHATGQVRGLLCDLCNRGLGYFADSAERLDVAATYLRRWSA